MASNDILECVEENELLNGHGSRNSIKVYAPRGNNAAERDGSEKDLIEYLKNSNYDSFRDVRNTHQMQDAPFDSSRSGSEEDMLDYEDEPMFNCNLCQRRRRCTFIEKGLIGFGVVCLIVIIVLAVRLGHREEPKVYKTCESEDCLQAASSILSAMDPTADPCHDFHQYACGGWLKETPIPPGYPIWNRFQELSYKSLYMLKNFIETHKLHGEAQPKVRTFYQSCMDESKVSRTKTLQAFRNLLANISSTDSDFNLPSALVKVHRLNTWPLFQLLVGPDERHPDNNIIKVEAGLSDFPYGIFKSNTTLNAADESNSGTQATSTQTTTTTKIDSGTSVHINITDHSNETDDTGYKVVTKTTPSPTTPTPNIKDTHPHPTENLSDLVIKYKEETVLLLISLFGKSKAQAEAESMQLLELEKRLSLAHDLSPHIHNRQQAYNAMSIPSLQNKCNMINWMSYFNDVIKSPTQPITQQHQVVVLHEDALLKVCDIFSEYMKSSSLKSVLRSYLLLSVARSLKPYFDLSTFDENLNIEDEVDIEGEHWRRCTFYSNKALGFATGSIYVAATSAEKSVTQDDDRVLKVKKIVEHVKKAFKDYLLRKIWLDPKTKKEAATKIDKMIEKVSYPSYILDMTFLDEYYKQFVIGQDWFRNLLNWREFNMRQMVSSLHEKYDRTKNWINPPVTVESDYSPIRNDINFPIALFHLPIFSLDGPSAMNFGAMGSLVGHEITHAFDIQGRQYDGYGRLRDWWDPVTASMFNETTFCMADQYNRYKVGNHTINGAQTLEENIADNGGLRAAQVAYELWVHEHGEDAPLPGVTLNNHQIFYVSYAQMYCSKWKEDGMTDFLLRDTHSPGPYRIQGALSNSLPFQQVFECSYTAKYNPATKCRVW